uniref:Uncharacterized protein n=1 Tax=Opuntia streptacantha TaxID=393608 RepID=A0A7C9ET86_OPUST
MTSPRASANEPSAFGAFHFTSNLGFKRDPDTLVSPFNSPSLNGSRCGNPGKYLCRILSNDKFPDKLTSKAASSSSASGQIQAFPAPRISPPSRSIARTPYKSATQLSVLKVKLADK